MLTKDYIAGYRAGGGGRPGSGLDDQDGGVWRDHARPGVELLPAQAELAPVFEMRVFEADLGQRVAGPGVGLGQVWRSGQARADAVIQGDGELHHVRVVEAFIANALVHAQVKGFSSGLDFSVGVSCGRRWRRWRLLIGCMEEHRS